MTTRRAAHRRRRTPLSLIAAVLGVGAPLCHADTAPPASSMLPPVSVIGTTPLPGLDLPQDASRRRCSRRRGAEIEGRGALSIADFMNRRFGSVHVNDVQGNLLQPDVSYRGYTASPLLGTPQGLSVYIDGVRMNQPFGDVVSWDLLPRSAIASITLMPGSNPLFGLNTLGGALAVQTKDGDRHPGSSLQLTAGSHGRTQAEVEAGGHDARGLSWYGTANVFQDGGWRDASRSRLVQAVRQTRLAPRRDPGLAERQRRVERPLRQRPAGRPAARRPLFERLHESGPDAQRRRPRQHRLHPRHRPARLVVRTGLPAPHRQPHPQRRRQRRRPRPAALRALRGRPHRARRRRHRRTADRRFDDDAVSLPALRRPGAAGRRRGIGLQRPPQPEPKRADPRRHRAAGERPRRERRHVAPARRRRRARRQPHTLRAGHRRRIPGRRSQRHGRRSVAGGARQERRCDAARDRRRSERANPHRERPRRRHGLLRQRPAPDPRGAL